MVGLPVALEQLGQVPRARPNIGPRIPQPGEKEKPDFLGGSPFLSRGRTNLHQTELPGPATSGGVKTALLPDDGFDQGGIDLVKPRRLQDVRIEPPVIATLEPPIDDGNINQGAHDQEPEPAMTHGA